MTVTEVAENDTANDDFEAVRGLRRVGVHSREGRGKGGHLHTIVVDCNVCHFLDVPMVQHKQRSHSDRPPCGPCRYVPGDVSKVTEAMHEELAEVSRLVANLRHSLDMLEGQLLPPSSSTYHGRPGALALKDEHGAATAETSLDTRTIDTS